MIAIDNKTLISAEQREAFFITLYQTAFSRVAHYVARMGGSFDEAQDVFQDALVIYYEKVISSGDGRIVNEKAYVMGIAKKIWLQRYKANNKNQPLSDFDMAVEAEEQISTNKMLAYLETAGKKCMALLKACYYDRLSVADIAVSFGYSSIHSASVAKYKCLEKVRETAKQNSLQYADFIE